MNTNNTVVSIDENDIWESLQFEVRNFFLNLPKNTREAYLNDLKQFFSFIQQYKIHPYQASQIHIEEFMNQVSNQGGRYIDGKNTKASDRTYNRKLATLTAFYDFLGQKKVISINPTQFVKRRILSLRVETNDLSNENVAKLLSLIPDTNYQYSRDRAIIATLFYTGIRRAEIASLKISNLNTFKNRMIFKLKIKGGREEEVPVSKSLEAIIKKYLEQCEINGVYKTLNSPLFSSIGNSEKCITDRGIYEIFMKWARKLKLSYKISPHSARATFIGALHDMGVSLEDNANSARHKDANMTKAYIKRKKGIEDSPVYNLDF